MPCRARSSNLGTSSPRVSALRYYVYSLFARPYAAPRNRHPATAIQCFRIRRYLASCRPDLLVDKFEFAFSVTKKRSNHLGEHLAMRVGHLFI